MATWLLALRRARQKDAHVRALLQRSQARGMGLRMTEALRDKLRPGWLKLHAPRDAHKDKCDQ
ncbi:hypothetical protein RAS1_19840 [Phycisphaerae bacterium RAS1]|nr:hypothetical protein RAS1_19840 [Phycisphaerae bacterium RAS1]